MAKGKLGRLNRAVERELRERALRVEQKKMQNQLLISDRMASMGTLAAGVAHEINNPLACVMVNLDLAVRDVAERAEKLGLVAEFSEIREELHDAREATERIRNIVRDLKIFSRADEEKQGAVDVQRVMESTLRMAWNEIRHRARLVKDYGKTPPVAGSESRLGQVFLNLVVNAAQAIAEGRAASNEIRISTSTAPNGNVVIEIADTGSGMAPEVLGQLFTPFFTTKPVGVGTGLGLSICHGIIAGFGGTIDVTSEVGKGTAFRISLLPAPSEIKEERPLPVVGKVPKRRGRFLVVDDEPIIAKVVLRLLSAEHDVITLGSAEEAFRRVEGGERFDVILCDLMMPQMTGMDLHAALSRVVPEQAGRMIFLSGGAFTVRARSFLAEVPNQRIEKPFDATHLRALINDRIR
jgi:nitrogen-specific signal transduction histidine kinase/CheY-like chemotaxis protein